MKLKTLIIINYVISGVVVSSIVALMTWIIIHENDFLSVCSQVFVTVLFDIAVVILFSYQLNYLISQKIKTITEQLNTIGEESPTVNTTRDLHDFHTIHDSIHSLERRYETTTNRLVQTNTNFSAMIRSLAHDIRTPMTIIQGYIEEMQDGIISPSEYPNALKVIRKEIDFVAELSTHSINYIYTCGKDYEGEVVPIKQFADEELFPLIRPRDGVRLINAVDEGFEIFMDKFELKQSLLNILHNASKFTYEGHIKIYSQNHCLVIEDSGIGIDKSDAEKLFQPFVKQTEHLKYENSGLGLGLSIARNLFEKYAYGIYFDVEFDKGARLMICKLYIDQSAKRTLSNA
jgi:two-component system sensor histidine kinase SaeS